jgi:HAD superfamily hydrolase (TIGR01490 family)
MNMKQQYKKTYTEQNQRVALFDLDGTLVEAHPWVGIAKHHFKAKRNILPTLWYISSHLGLTPFWKIGLLSKEDYYKSWGKNASYLMKGIKTNRAKEVFEWLSDKYLLPTLKKGTLERLKKHQKDGFLTILISGSFQGVVDVMANRLNIDHAIGTKLEVIENKVSGRIIPPVCLGQGKVKLSKDFFVEKNLKIDFQESFAYTDSVFDLPLLQLVGNPVAVSPDKELLSLAKKEGWEIIK